MSDDYQIATDRKMLEVIKEIGCDTPGECVRESADLRTAMNNYIICCDKHPDEIRFIMNGGLLIQPRDGISFENPFWRPQYRLGYKFDEIKKNAERR